MSGVTKAAKFGDSDLPLLEWMRLQPEGDSALIKVALYTLMDQRSGGGNHSDSTPNNTPPDVIADLLKEIKGIREAVRLGVKDAIKESPMTTAWQNRYEETEDDDPEPVPDPADLLLADMLAGLGSLGD